MRHHVEHKRQLHVPYFHFNLAGYPHHPGSSGGRRISRRRGLHLAHPQARITSQDEPRRSLQPLIYFNTPSQV